MAVVYEADANDDEHGRSIVALISQLAASHEGRRMPMTEGEKRNLLTGLARLPRKCILLAELNGEVCGIAVCFLQFSTFSGKDMLKIHDLYVVPHCRGKGIGRQLIGAAFDRATALGCRFVNVEVTVENAAARRLYRSVGFVDWITPTMFMEMQLPG